MKRFSVLLGALTLLAFLSFSAKADARKTNTPMPTFTLYAGDAVTAPDDALENMPLDLIRAESPLGNRDFCLVIPENWNAKNLRIYFDAETLLVNGTEYRSILAFCKGEGLPYGRTMARLRAGRPLRDLF